jgi:hypothetical protein
MITAAPHRLGRWFWETFAKLAIKLRFRELIYIPEGKIKTDQSILLIGNHISWWDGFWPLEINRRHWRKKYHVMMLEEELRKRLFMRRGGAFSIRPGHRSVADSLNYTASLLESRNNLVLIYPQGKIHSIYEQEIRFLPGIERVFQQVKGDFRVVLFATLLDYGSFSRPTIRFYTKTYQGERNTSALNADYQQFIDECLARQGRMIDP